MFRKHGVEVLLLSDRIDEWVVTHLTEFDGKKLQSVSEGSLDLTKLGEPESAVADTARDDEFRDLLTRVRAGRAERPRGVPCA